MTNERKSVAQLVKSQHEQSEETEFYPSTQEIVDKVAEWLSKSESETQSILDIGCGNGSFFDKLDKTDCFHNSEKNYHSRLHSNYEKYGIEKSNILAEQLPEDVVLLGSDFHSNTLIDKKVDCIFCNPPYSEDDYDLSQWSNFDIRTKDGKVFCNVKLYKNGNRHLKFCTDFMKKLNVEMARINGWIHDRKEAVKEFGYTEQEINSIWEGNLKIGIGEGRNLLGLPDAMGA